MSRISFGSKGEEGRKKQRMDKVNTKCKIENVKSHTISLSINNPNLLEKRLRTSN